MEKLGNYIPLYTYSLKKQEIPQINKGTIKYFV